MVIGRNKNPTRFLAYLCRNRLSITEYRCTGVYGRPIAYNRAPLNVWSVSGHNDMGWYPVYLARESDRLSMISAAVSHQRRRSLKG